MLIYETMLYWPNFSPYMIAQQREEEEKERLRREEEERIRLEEERKREEELRKQRKTSATKLWPIYRRTLKLWA